MLGISAVAQGQTRFVENLGQWPSQVVARGDVGGGAIFLEYNAITYELWDKAKLSALHDRTASDSLVQFHVVKLHLQGANPRPTVVKSRAFETMYNYYLGADPQRWAGGALAYEEFLYREVYPYIDLLIESTLDGFKYSFLVYPGGNPSHISFRVEGAPDLFVDQGRCVMLTTAGTIEEEAPYCHQQGMEVPSAFRVEGDVLGFDLGEYDPAKTLVIDPSVVFSTLSLSISDNWGFTATYDAEGNGYSGGTVYGATYPTTTGAYQRTWGGGPTGDNLARDCGIYKVSPNGLSLLYMTFFGGSHNEQPHSLVVDHAGNLVVYGSTLSSDLPINGGVKKTYGGGHDIFLAKFNSNGSKLLASTYLGDSGNDGLNGEYDNASVSDFRNPSELVYNYGDLYRGEVIVDSFNNIYLASTTESVRFQVTAGAYMDRFGGGEQDAVVVKLNPNLDKLIWSTFLGGSSHDAAYSIDLDKFNNVYVTGGTKSSNYPMTGSAYDGSYNGGMSDAFVCHLSADGSSLLASTFLGTSGYDQGFFVKVGPDNKPYLLGQTDGSGFPTVGTSGNASLGLFVAKMQKDLSKVLISRIIGANGIVNISPAAFTVDQCGRVYFSGWGGLVAGDNTTGNTAGLTTTVDAVKRTTNGRDFYMAVYTKDLATPIYATFFGGTDMDFGSSSEHVDGGTSRFDKRGMIYQAICAACNGSQPSPISRFPTSPGNVYGPSSKHNKTTNCNNALVKIDLEGPALFAEFEHTDISCKVPQQVSFTNYTKGAKDFTWIMGDGTTYTDSNVVHTYAKPGIYRVQLIAYNPIACNLRDTQTLRLAIYGKSEADFTANVNVCDKSVALDHTGQFANTYYWDFGDGGFSTNKNEVRTYKKGIYEIRLITDKGTPCADTVLKSIVIEEVLTDFVPLLDTCSRTVTLDNRSTGIAKFLWRFGDGTTSTEEEPTRQYGQRGIYTISLTTNLGMPCEDSLEAPIRIIDVEADFEFKIDTCTGSVNFFNNSQDASGYRWALSDGRKFGEAEPLIGFSLRDTSYRIQLMAAPFSACRDTLSTTFRVPGLPTAGFAFSADTCVSAIQFMNKSVDAPSVLWDFGNGQTSRSRHPFHNYRDTGKFLVTLIAYPYSLCPDTQQLTIRIDTFRFAQFETLIDTCLLWVGMTNRSEDLDSFRWDFGDGNDAYGLDQAHVYEGDGNYTITMWAVNTRNGCRDTVQYAIWLPPLPMARYTQTTDSCLNTYLFADTSLYANHTVWQWGKADQVIGKSYRVSFRSPGVYRVYMHVRSPYGCWDTTVIDIPLDSLPKARFSYSVDSCQGSLLMRDRSYGAFRWWWDLDEGQRTREQGPMAVYGQEGNKTIYLVINPGTECEDTLKKEVFVTRYYPERISAPNVFTPNGDGYNDTWKMDHLRKDCDQYTLFIYNRWGVLVREISGNVDFEWDGNNYKEPVLGSGTPLNPGVYFYLLVSAKWQQNGSITIVR